MASGRGTFIVLDGPDGCGKSTQIERLRDALASTHREIVCCRDPGGTAIGESIRQVLLDPANGRMTVKAELFLYMASRAQLVDEVIRPALQRGAIVISDRFLSSSMAYQGAAGGLGMDEVARIGGFCTGGITPDLTLILDVHPRTGGQRRGPRAADRIEQRSEEYHQKVREGFLALARRDPDRVRVVDASREVSIVSQDVLKWVSHVL
jgi:dTMP kinase